MRFALYAVALAFMVTDAIALTPVQKDAAIADAFLGVAEVRCGVAMNKKAYKLLQNQMHPSGVDQDALTFQVSEQDKAFELYAADPVGFCNTAIGLYGPNGTAKRGLLEPR